MLSDTDDSELSSESSSSEEDCEDSDEYSTVDYSETETISATTNSRVTLAFKWKEGAGKSLKRVHGNGSERTSRRKRKNLGELAQAASGCLDIGALFRRQQDLGIYDNCFRRKERCRCISKKTCAPCKKRQREGCKDCDDLPPKCTSESWFPLGFYPSFHINSPISFRLLRGAPADCFRYSQISWHKSQRLRR
jgi:hypothetical protein